MADDDAPPVNVALDVARRYARGGRVRYDEGGPVADAPDAAARAIREAGIPGIKYLDQGSRGAGQGTSNYVVWSPEIIEILRKYGIAAPVAAGILEQAYGGQHREY